METTLPDDRAQIHCAWCGEPAEIAIDIFAGSHQQYVEDCWVCCRPNVLTIAIHGDQVSVSVEPE